MYTLTKYGYSVNGVMTRSVCVMLCFKFAIIYTSMLPQQFDGNEHRPFTTYATIQCSWNVLLCVIDVRFVFNLRCNLI